MRKTNNSEYCEYNGYGFTFWLIVILAPLLLILICFYGIMKEKGKEREEASKMILDQDDTANQSRSLEPNQSFELDHMSHTNVDRTLAEMEVDVSRIDPRGHEEEGPQEKYPEF